MIAYCIYHKLAILIYINVIKFIIKYTFIYEILQLSIY